MSVKSKKSDIVCFLSLQRQREAAELALNGGEGQQKEIEEPEEEM